MQSIDSDMVVILGEITRKAEIYYSQKGLYEKLGVSKATIAKWKKEGKLPAPVTINGVDRYRESDIEKMIALQNPHLASGQTLNGEASQMVKGL